MKKIATLISSLVLSVAAGAAPIALSVAGVGSESGSSTFAAPSGSPTSAVLSVSGTITPPTITLNRPAGDTSGNAIDVVTNFYAELTLTIPELPTLLFGLDSADGEGCTIQQGGQSCNVVFQFSLVPFEVTLTGVELSDFLSGPNALAFGCSLAVVDNDFGGETTADCVASVRYLPDDTTGIPEPGSLALMGLALAGLGVSARRRKSA